jgi:hypothetical protein
VVEDVLLLSRRLMFLLSRRLMFLLTLLLVLEEVHGHP